MRTRTEEERKESSGGDGRLQTCTDAPRPPGARPAPSGPRGGRRRAGAAPGARRLPLGDVKSAGAQALAVQHRLGIGLLLPEPLGRPGWRETFEEAHRGGEGQEDADRGGAEAQQDTARRVSPRKRWQLPRKSNWVCTGLGTIETGRSS